MSFEQLVLAYLQRPPPGAAHDDPAPAAERPGPTTKAVTSMIWVSWRQHRSQAIACLALLAALAVFAIIARAPRCARRSATTASPRAWPAARRTACPAAVSAFMNEFGSAVNIAFWSVTLIVPGLIGVLVGGAADRPGTRIRHLAAGLEPDRSPDPVAGHQAGPGHRRAHRPRRGHDRGDHLVPRADGPAHRASPCSTSTTSRAWSSPPTSCARSGSPCWPGC